MPKTKKIVPPPRRFHPSPPRPTRVPVTNGPARTARAWRGWNACTATPPKEEDSTQ